MTFDTRKMRHAMTRLIPTGPTLLLAMALAAWAPFTTAETFNNLRFYPGEEPTAENRPSKRYPITLSFSGRIYEPELRIDGATRLTPDEEFIRRVEQVNREGTREEILALWDPKEKAEIGRDLDDPALFNRNRMTYENRKSSAFVLKVRYGPYVLFLVQSENEMVGKQLQIYPIRETESDYVLTNDLADDPMLEFLYFLNRRRIGRLDGAETDGAPATPAN